MMKGYYSEHGLFDIPYPTVPGWEGSGTVVLSGGGLFAWRISGVRVAFVRKVKEDGDNIETMELGGCYQ